MKKTVRKIMTICALLTLIFNVIPINAQNLTNNDDLQQYETVDRELLLNIEDMEVVHDTRVESNHISENKNAVSERFYIPTVRNFNSTLALDDNLIELGVDKLGSINSISSQALYTFSIEKDGIITADLCMPIIVDFDLYILDAEYNFIGYSENAGLGETELIKMNASAGTYHILINGYFGTGNFTTCVYFGTNDIREINDLPNTASSYTRNSRMTATIDSPYDYDFYKIIVNSTQAIDHIFEYTFDKPVGYDYQIFLYDGSYLYSIQDSGAYNLNAGTYYFVVRSDPSTMKFSNTAYYGLKILDYKQSSDSTAVYKWYTADKKAIFQFNANRTAYYVNGNPINFTYSRTYNASGGKVYINLYKKSDQFVALMEEETYYVGELPDFINYRGPFTGDKSYSNALLLSLGNTNLVVNSFSPNYPSINSGRAMIVIDSDTGNVVDIMEPNPIYDGVYVSWTRIPGTLCNYNTY